jgi:hypothetical protein
MITPKHYRGYFVFVAMMSLTTTTIVACSTSSGHHEDDRWTMARVRPSGESLDLLFVNNTTWGGERPEALVGTTKALVDIVFRSSSSQQRVVDLHAGIIDMVAGTGGYDIANCSDPSRGALQNVRRCDDGGTIDRPFVSSSLLEPNDGSPSDPDGRSWWEDLSCIARPRNVTHECELEQPLEALRLALTDRIEDGTNAGFFREGAVLAVIISTDEDDCSPVDPTFFDPERDDLAELGYLGLRCFANADQLEPVNNFADLLLEQRPQGRIVTAGWLTVPQGWDGDVDALLPQPELDWRDATIEDLELCPEVYDAMIKSPRLAEFMVLTSGEDLVWSMCDNSILEEGMESIGRHILEHLDPLECLPSAPAEDSRCDVTLLPLDSSEPCPAATTQASPGVCSLRDDQWEIVETAECTALRPRPGLEVRPGAALEIRCTGPADDGG